MITLLLVAFGLGLFIGAGLGALAMGLLQIGRDPPTSARTSVHLEGHHDQTTV